MLEVVRDYFKLNDQHLHAEIQGMHHTLIEILSTKGINYTDLRAALVPAIDKHEAGFIFDSTAIESSWYGREVMQRILPLLDKKTTQSLLCGDLLGKDQDFIFEILDESLVLSRSFKFKHGVLLFCVYINNISDELLKKLHQELTKLPAYLGYIPATFESRAKTYLSTVLVNDFLKNGCRIIMGHEADRSNDENVNILGYPFEEFGYKVFSLQSDYFGIFLSFKIERAIYKGFEVDTEMAINSISDKVLPLQKFKVVLEEAKHGYLKTEKAGKLRKAGIADLKRKQIELLIKSKLAASYIYNMVLNEYGRKFNLVIEVNRGDGGYPTRLLVGLEYAPEDKVLRVITMY